MQAYRLEKIPPYSPITQKKSWHFRPQLHRRFLGGINLICAIDYISQELVWGIDFALISTQMGTAQLAWGMMTMLEAPHPILSSTWSLKLNIIHDLMKSGIHAHRIHGQERVRHSIVGKTLTSSPGTSRCCICTVHERMQGRQDSRLSPISPFHFLYFSTYLSLCSLSLSLSSLSLSLFLLLYSGLLFSRLL